jgi:hypothetical protein
MRRSFYACALALGAVCAAAPLAAQQTLALGVLVPIGGLDPVAATGFGATLRNESYLSHAWSIRTDVGYEYFGGKGTVKNTQTTSFALNLVQHPTSALYAFGGAGLYLRKTTRTLDSQSRATNTIGFQGGVGLQLGDLWRFPLSAEIAVVHTAGKENYSWFPLRFAVGF